MRPSTSGRRATTSTLSTAGVRRDDPQFYDPADRDKLLLETNVNGVLDMPRDGNGQAIIPERRNDENLIIVQFHKAVIQFHNQIVDYARAQGMRKEWVFETARRLTRWHYQWAVIHDFLPRFVGDELVGTSGTVYKEIAGKSPVITLSYYKPTNKDGRPFMPVEFAVAAYRFGHSIIRPFYVLNDSRGGASMSLARRTACNLNGGRPIPCRPGHRVEEHPSRRSEQSRCAQAAQDRHQAVDTARQPTRRPLSRPQTRRSTWPCATTAAARRSACHRGSRSPRRCGSPRCPTHPRAHRFEMGRRGAVVVLHPERGRAGAVQG